MNAVGKGSDQAKIICLGDERDAATGQFSPGIPGLDANGASASSIGNSLRGCLGGRAQRNRPRNGKPSKDRDVLAAAVVCRAQTVVTLNLRDFPADALAAWNVEAQRPDEFLIHQYYLDPAAVMAILREQAA